MTLERQNWRDYQASLKKTAAKKKLIKTALRLSLFIPIFIITFYTINFSLSIENRRSSIESQQAEPESFSLKKKDLQLIIEDKSLSNLSKKSFDLQADGKDLHINTSIDIELQQYILQKISRVKKLTRGKPRYLAIVAMDPETGKILSMAGFDKTSLIENPCLSSSYPAASIFKIVTAAAAVEECGFNPRSKLKFNGGKYTLYKNQLKEKNNKYTNKITFNDSFAQSVNPIFGKIGSLYLGKNTLEKYANAFGFNRSINFEFPMQPSSMSLSDEPYQWAEIACGFNRDTVISPLHGAMLSGAIVNSGRLPEPTIIDQVIDSNGNVLYSSTLAPINQAITPETSKILKKLMSSTISSGTGKKSFRGYKKDPILGRLNIGGKTGSISNKAHDVRFDWFVGYAEEKKGDMKIAISVVVGHEKYIGTKACKYARMVMKHYFDNQFAKNEINQLLAQTAHTKKQDVQTK